MYHPTKFLDNSGDEFSFSDNFEQRVSFNYSAVHVPVETFNLSPCQTCALLLRRMPIT